MLDRLQFTLADLRCRLKGEFREEDHPRADDGKFGSGGGSSKPAPGAGGADLDESKLPDSIDATHAAAEKAARGWLKKLAGLPAATVDLAKRKAGDLYRKMEAKYGKGWARAIVSVGIVTFPTPFTTGAVLTMIGLAKLSLKLSGRAAAPAVQAMLRMLRAKVYGEGQDSVPGGDGDIDLATAFRRAGKFVSLLVESLGGAELDGAARRQLERVAEGLSGKGSDDAGR